jgi:hypothetical protein
MFGNSHFERVHQLFADQFEPDGAGFLYRKSMKDAPIRVTEEERNDFVSVFKRRLRYGAWSLVPTTLLLIGLPVVLGLDIDSPSTQAAAYVGLALIMAPFLAIYYWAWKAPARQLERRPSVGEARSRAEVRELMFAKITYGQLALAVISALLLVWKVSAENDVIHGWDVLWLVLAAALIFGVAVQAFRKWRHERG